MYMHSRVHRSPPPPPPPPLQSRSGALDSALHHEVLKSHNCDIYIRATLTTRAIARRQVTQHAFFRVERTNERVYVCAIASANARPLIYEGIMQSRVLHTTLIVIPCYIIRIWFCPGPRARACRSNCKTRHSLVNPRALASRNTPGFELK